MTRLTCIMALALVASGCGSKDEGTSNKAPPATTTAPGSGSAAPTAPTETAAERQARVQLQIAPIQERINQLDIEMAALVKASTTGETGAEKAAAKAKLKELETERADLESKLVVLRAEQHPSDDRKPSADPTAQPTGQPTGQPTTPAK